MIKKRQLKWFTVLLAIIMLIGSQLMPSAQLAQAKGKQQADAMEVLKGLTKE